MEQTYNSRESRLLSLPPELRNAIYREVLLENGVVRITNEARPAPPSLLQVNRQIRKEATAIYYKENTLRFCIWKFDAGVYITWSQLFTFHGEFSTRWSFEGPRNWENLLQWVEASYTGKCTKLQRSSTSPPQSSTGKTIVVGKFFDLMNNLSLVQGMSWEKVKEQLEVVHDMLCATDEVWESEKDSV